MREYKYLNSSIIWLKLKVDVETRRIICFYGPTDNSDMHIKERFWEEVGECLEAVEMKYSNYFVGMYEL